MASVDLEDLQRRLARLGVDLDFVGCAEDAAAAADAAAADADADPAQAASGEDWEDFQT